MAWRLAVAVLACLAYAAHGQEQPPSTLPAYPKILKGEFSWTVGNPLLAPADRPEDPCLAIKDPTVVQYDGAWHLFCTIRSQKRTHQIEYLSFADWKDAARAPRHILKLTDGYFCAPQVFYFTPHRKWYLVYQVNDKTRQPALQPAFSTNDNIANPAGWTAPTLLFAQSPRNVRQWIDFWVICDERNAYLFFTSLDGHVWRSETRLEDFPARWKTPVIAFRGDLFEASHTYSMRRLRRYLTIVEAQSSGRRYYKAYVATSLGGIWSPLADTLDKPFASPANVREADGAEHWTDSFSHGEILRLGHDQQMEIDPQRLRFLFQGVADGDKAGRNYGQVPWRLGLLE